MDMVLLLGVVTGMRCMTAIAALSWAVWLGLVPEQGWATWSRPSRRRDPLHDLRAGRVRRRHVAEDTAAHRTRDRRWRELLWAGWWVRMVAKAINEPVAGGIIFGAVGAIIGTWGGFFVRMTVARIFRRDLPAALLESASAIALAIFAVVRTASGGIVMDLQKAAS